MKLHFEPNLDYQLQAIEAVCGLFHGQETCRTEFTVTRDAASGQMALFENDLGIGNRLTLLDEELLANLHAIHSAMSWHPRPRSRPGTSPWRWRPAPVRPTSICAPSSS